MVAFGEIQQRVMLAVHPALRVVIYRRLMLRIAEGIAARVHAGALVTGEVIGQVASQTLENLTTIGSVATLPVFRPLIGMDKVEITVEAQRLGSSLLRNIPPPGRVGPTSSPPNDCSQSTILSARPSRARSWRTSTSR
jgi:adenylyl- and sulfurtransferase ThiI